MPAAQGLTAQEHGLVGRWVHHELHRGVGIMLAHLLTMEDLRENPLTWPPFAPQDYEQPPYPGLRDVQTPQPGVPSDLRPCSVINTHFTVAVCSDHEVLKL